ncbi:MAG TPA: GH116 family glycosyl hydrolase, partial [Fibrobacteraceae bacterium]|nr:GH116 family glycosyl hydrolase [Fibrobacteraceae bacterium]
LVDDQLANLRKAVKESIPLSESKTEMVIQINCWLNESSIPEEVDLSRRQLREFKKEWLTAQCPKAFTASWQKKIHLDNDDIFVDSMLADTYLRLLGLSPITDVEKVRRSLKKVYEMNYKANSPLIGAANLVHVDGSPLDEFNFQAHDVWIGIQFSLITAMLMHGLKSEAEDLIESMVKNLYNEARIPFAAPEGFNGSCRLHPETIEKNLNLSKASAAKLHKNLLSAKILLPDSRVSPMLTRDLATFKKTYKSLIQTAKVDETALFSLIHNTALKYTAGKYFRPGMVFAIVQAAKFMK